MLCLFNPHVLQYLRLWIHDTRHFRTRFLVKIWENLWGNKRCIYENKKDNRGNWGYIIFSIRLLLVKKDSNFREIRTDNMDSTEIRE